MNSPLHCERHTPRLGHRDSKTYHVGFVSRIIVDRVDDSMSCNQEHGQVAKPSMVAHSVLKRYMNQSQYRRSSRYRKEEERHSERDHLAEKLPRFVQFRLPSAKQQAHLRGVK